MRNGVRPEGGGGKSCTKPGSPRGGYGLTASLVDILSNGRRDDLC